MKIDIVTLFPKMFDGPFKESIIGKAIENKIVEINIHNLRQWAQNKYKQVDDNPFGGGAGMVLMIEPIYECLQNLRTKDSHIIALSAKGNTIKQSTVKRLSKKSHLILITGHYEGFDQRILDDLVDEVLSIGEFILTGGEIPTMALVDAIVRLNPGVVGKEESITTDSFYNDDKTKQYPQYTRPAIFETIEGKKLQVPEILLSGDHGKIDEWRKNNTSLGV